MQTHAVQSDDVGLFVLVGDIRCRPSAETFYKTGEQVIVEITGANAVVKDKPTNGYSEKWHASLPPPKPKTIQNHKPITWQDLVENTWYYIPLTLTMCLWSFSIGLFLGWALLNNIK